MQSPYELRNQFVEISRDILARWIITPNAEALIAKPTEDTTPKLFAHLVIIGTPRKLIVSHFYHQTTLSPYSGQNACPLLAHSHSTGYFVYGGTTRIGYNISIHRWTQYKDQFNYKRFLEYSQPNAISFPPWPGFPLSSRLHRFLPRKPNWLLLSTELHFSFVWHISTLQASVAPLL